MHAALRHWRPPPGRSFISSSLSIASSPSAWASSARQPGPLFASEARTLFQLRCYASKSKAKDKQKGKANAKADKTSKRDEREEEDAEDRWPEAGRDRRGTNTAELVPGSQQALAGEALAEHKRTDAKLSAAVDWLKRSAATMELQGVGRVTPEVLRRVRVSLPSRTEDCSIEEVAVVGVREGTTLLVTPFDEADLKHIEKAIYTANIPHVVPQKLNNATLQIPMPKPTIDAREELAKAGAKAAEETRVQLRKTVQLSIKKGGYAKRSIELEEFNELLQRHLKTVDTIVSDLKKKLGAK